MNKNKELYIGIVLMFMFFFLALGTFTVTQTISVRYDTTPSYFFIANFILTGIISALSISMSLILFTIFSLVTLAFL